MTPEQIPQTQKAAVVRNKQVAIETVPVVQPADLKPNEALVKVLYSGVCHTDLHAQLGDWPLIHKEPLIGGHEGAGIIVAIGEHSDTDLKLGDRVGIKWLADSCLKCSYCRQGYEPLCHHALCSGFSVDGSFQQYAVSFTRHLTKIPKELPMDKAAPILCAGVTVYKALKQSNARPGEWVVLPGAGGGLGHLAVQYAHYMGLRCIAVDTGAEKKALCERLGAERWIDFKETKDIVAAVKAATPDGDGPHAAIVTSSVGAAYEEALQYVRPHGTVVAVGLPPDAKVSADVFWTVFLEKQLKGSYVGNRQDAIEALEIAASGALETSFRTLPLKDLPSVYDQLHAGSLVGRVVLDLWA
ncbi:mannitol-1-phosphate dehydrogenase [Dacryopinax primogenitus]|uniref:alcohol dehydrogenase n=1 Tax=Dacryopinax primogenitus (strain DJM 731) TaxID=1858805 RepID=M5FVU5_DACPD|nr:mannitol-1-phosphate dehydrogenase [Dacryopinax primogenitus]EJU01966.1 mannitol-1-phosphate dehydrogenase [Dacryopinax primogenitus]